MPIAAPLSWWTAPPGGGPASWSLSARPGTRDASNPDRVQLQDRGEDPEVDVRPRSLPAVTRRSPPAQAGVGRPDLRARRLGLVPAGQAVVEIVEQGAGLVEELIGDGEHLAGEVVVLSAPLGHHPGGYPWSGPPKRHEPASTPGSVTELSHMLGADMAGEAASRDETYEPTTFVAAGHRETRGGTVLRWVVLGWFGLSIVTALLIGRAARDRRPDAPLPAPVPAEPVPAFSSDLVAVHGVAQTTSMLEGALATLRTTWSTMDAATVDQVLAMLHDHVATANDVLDGLLAAEPLLTARLDAITPDFHMSQVAEGDAPNPDTAAPAG